MHQVRAQFGADAALLLDLERRRQGAGLEQLDEFAGALDREIAFDNAGTASDRAVDDRRRNDAAVEHNGEFLADILCRSLAELCGAFTVETKLDVRTLVLVGTDVNLAWVQV